MNNLSSPRPLWVLLAASVAACTVYPAPPTQDMASPSQPAVAGVPAMTRDNIAMHPASRPQVAYFRINWPKTRQLMAIPADTASVRISAFKFSSSETDPIDSITIVKDFAGEVAMPSKAATVLPLGQLYFEAEALDQAGKVLAKARQVAEIKADEATRVELTFRPASNGGGNRPVVEATPSADPSPSASPSADPSPTASPSMDPSPSAPPSMDPFPSDPPSMDPFPSAPPSMDPFPSDPPS